MLGPVEAEEVAQMHTVDHLRLEAGEPDLSHWSSLVRTIESAQRTARIAVVGKYVTLPDAYLSVVESLTHAGFANGAQVEIRWIAAGAAP